MTVQQNLGLWGSTVWSIIAVIVSMKDEVRAWTENIRASNVQVIDTSVLTVFSLIIKGPID